MNVTRRRFLAGRRGLGSRSFGDGVRTFGDGQSGG